MGIQGQAVSGKRCIEQGQKSAKIGLIGKAKWLVGASVLAASTSVMAAPPLVISNVGAPTQVGSGQGKRAVWTNAGTVGGTTVDIVGIVTTASLNHNWTTTANRPSITASGQDNIQIEWRIYQAGTYNIASDTGGVAVVADVHVQINDVDGPNNERVFVPVCAGDVQWVRIDANATTGRAFGTVSGQPETFSLIGDQNYNNQPVSGLEIFYPDRSVFRMGRTANNGFLIRLDNPSYSEFDTLDLECADFSSPVAVDDSQEGVPGTPTVLNILDNDSNATNNNNPTNNNSLKPSEYGRSTVALIPPAGATGITTDTIGPNTRITGFTVPGEGTWAFDRATGELTFTPDPSFVGYATTIDYNFTNALGIVTPVPGTVTVWYPGIGVTKSSVFNDTNSDTYGQVGETIDYIYQVKSYGAEPLRNISIAETGFTGAGTAPTPVYDAGDANSDNMLDLTETWTFLATYTLVAADLTAGNVANSATGTGRTAAGTVVNDVSDSSNPSDGNGTPTSGPGPNNGDPTRTPLARAPIAAANNSQTGTIFANNGISNAYNVLGNDALKGVAPTPSTVALTVVTPASNAGVTLDTATGLVSVAPGTPAGSYTIDYQICEVGNPTNCANAQASIVVTAPAPITTAPDAPAPVVSATGGSNIINAIANDQLNGSPVAIADIDLTVTTPASNPGVTLDPATGLVSVAPGTPPGNYTITYQICERANPTNCASNTVTVVVNPTPIIANDDPVPAVNGRTGNPSAFNAFANDTLNGAPVVASAINTTVTSAATPLAPGAPVPTLDTATGNVAVPAGTPAGNYTIGYRICEIANPTNCEDATITVAVAAAPIAATNDSAGPVTTATGGSNLVNALTNDTLNGAPVVIANINLSVVTPASNAGVTLDTATGQVSVAPGTPAGSYTIGYRICENLNATNCALANVVVQVNPTPITATADAPAPVPGIAGGNDIINAFDNDRLNGAPIVLSAITASVTTPAAPATPGAPVPVLDPATGLVDVPANTPAGTYTINYRICEAANPANCANSSVTVVVTAAPIVADPDSASGVNGATGATGVLDVLNGDMLNGMPATLATVDISVTTPATPASPGAPVPVLNPATGLVDVPAGTPAGTYNIVYQICEELNPTNCATNTATVTVAPSPIVATNDGASGINGAVGATAVTNAFTGDTINGVAASPSNAILSVTAGNSVPAGLTFNTATGNVDVAPGTPAGRYVINYTICERLNPSNCRDATITVDVVAAPIVADPDSATGVNGATGAPGVLDVLNGDTLNGAPATLATVDIRITTPAASINGGPVPALNPATGLVDVPAGTPAGTYNIVYEICEELNPTNCATNTATVTVAPAPVVATNDSASGINGTAGATAVVNAFTSDTVNGVAASPSNATLAVASGSSVPSVLEFNPATGAVNVRPGTPAGSYSFDYTLCEILNPTNCRTATITVTVVAAPIVADPDGVSGVNGATGATGVLDVLNGDMLNGMPATLGTVDISVTTPATPASPGAPVPALNSATGLVDVPAGTPAGTYNIVYQICEELNPSNCSTNTATVTVAPSPIVATNDSASNVNGATGATAVANAFTSDTVNGVAASPANATLSVTSGTTVPAGLTFNTATGSVDVAPGTPAGSYVINYTICETLNPTSCRDATITVDVIAAPIFADPDSATGINGATGATGVLDVLNGDMLNGIPATLATVDISVRTPATPASPGAPVPVLNPATGLVDVPAGTPAGTYNIVYQICEELNPTNCATNTATVTVAPAPIVATNDSASGINGLAGATAVANAFTSDTINGVAASPSNATLSVTTGTTVPAGLTFNTATGSVDVAPGTPAGSYVINYTICETLNPSNCRDATITVDVVAAPIAATNDSAGPVTTAVGGANLVDALTNDTLNGILVVLANVNLTVTSRASNPGVTLDPATGQVSVAPGTPAGNYAIGYQICERLNPANCATATVAVVVNATPIDAANDAPSPINGATGNPNAINAFANDTLNGVPVVPSAITATILTPASNPGVAMDPATGQVSVAPGTPAGTYTISYQICETANPTNCETATVTVVVEAAPIAASPDAPAPVNGTAGGNDIINALSNDTLNGTPVAIANVNLTITAPATPASAGAPVPVLDPATGLVDVPANTPAGTYTVGYQICEQLNPTNCANSVVTVVVTAAPIAATPDAPPAVNGANGNPSVTNAFTNDTLNGVPVVPALITATVTSPASNPGVALDSATGVVSVAPGTPAGTYTIGYQICETLNPTNCATSTVTIVVDAAPIAATNDDAGTVPGVAGGSNLVNALVNDSLNGQPVNIANVDLTVTAPASNPGVTLDPATGMVSVAPNTPAGTYSIGYQICEKLNPTNCATATVAVVVQASAITATPDAPAPVNGATGGNDIVNAFTNDMLNGVPVVPANITATVTTPATPLTPGAPVPVMDPATGFVDVPPGTPAGTYTIEYQICENLNPSNCATSSATVVVQPPAIVAGTDTPPSVRGDVGNPNAVNAFANDTLNGIPVDPALINATVVTPASDSGVVLDPVTGNVSVAPGTPAGTYTIEYEICERLNPTNCAISTVTIVVDPPVGAISGTVYEDVDGDRVPDPGEPRRAGWIVEVIKDGVVIATVATDSEGNYTVPGLLNGPGYSVQFRSPENNVVYDRIENVSVNPGTTVVDQNLPIDPSGIFYNSVTRQPIAGVTARLMDANGVLLPAICFLDPSQANQTTGASGEYRFDIIPGAAPQCPVGETVYRIVATPPGGFAPNSTVVLPQPGPFDPTGLPAPVRINPTNDAPSGANPPYYLDFRLASGDPDIIYNHIALDPFLTRTPLVVTKTSIKRSASVGDIVPYEITVRNTENVQRAGVDVVDILPAGMKYVLGTSTVNGAPQEPVAANNNRELTWRGQVIPANGSVRYNLTLIVGAGVTGGEKVNTGVAENGLNGSEISNRGTAVVTITPNAVFDCSELLGKVFEDSNRNGYQDENEPGVPGVRLATVNGQLITTDEFGRYHIACAAVPDARIGSNFVLKVDTRTLPLGWDVTTDNPRSIRLTRGKFGELNFGVAPKEESSPPPGGSSAKREEKGE